MVLYKNTKAMINSPDRDTDFFEFIIRVSDEDIFAPCILIHGINYLKRQ